MHLGPLGCTPGCCNCGSCCLGWLLEVQGLGNTGTSGVAVREMATLGIEPRLPEYVPGALPLSYLALGYQSGLHLLSTLFLG
jgi:hypothetical protein